MGKARKTATKRSQTTRTKRERAVAGKAPETGNPPEAQDVDASLDGDGRASGEESLVSEARAPVEESPAISSEPAAEAPPTEVSKETESNDVDAPDQIVGPAADAGHRGWPVDLSKVDVVRERESTFIVFIDQELRLRWLADSKSELSDESQNIIARARLVAATPTTYLKEGQQKAWMRMLGESLALALAGDVENSTRTLSMAETFVGRRATETARLWYVKASLLACMALVAVGGTILLVPRMLPSASLQTEAINTSEAGANAKSPKAYESGQRWFETIGAAILFGAIGSQFSVLLRLSTLNVDPGAGRDAHYVSAVVRILMGAFAAVIAVVAVEAEIVLGFLKNVSKENAFLIPTVALLAGVSERFVPGILQKVETSSVGPESKVDGEQLTDEQA